jgi:cytochrome c-type biogenesis protein CcmE
MSTDGSTSTPAEPSAPAAKKKNNGPLVAVAALLVAGAALAFIAYGNLGDNLVYYWSPSEMQAQGPKAFGPTIRLGGVVVPGSIQWAPTRTSVAFQVADSPKPDAAKVNVQCDQTPPQMFRDGIGVVVEGTYDSTAVFKSSRLMINHSNEYRPPKPGDDPNKWKEDAKKTMDGTQAAR